MKSKDVVEKEIIKELLKESKWYEKILIKIHIRFIDKTITFTRIFILNKLLKK